MEIITGFIIVVVFFLFKWFTHTVPSMYFLLPIGEKFACYVSALDSVPGAV